MFVTDESSSAALARPTTYHVPMAYRGAPLPGAEHALVGTSRHGVLGKRWISRPRPSVAPPSGFSSTGSPVSPSRKYRALQLT